MSSNNDTITTNTITTNTIITNTIITNTTNQTNQIALDNIANKLIKYLYNPQQDSFDSIIKQFNDCIKQLGKEFLDRCDYIFSQINQNRNCTNHLFLQKIDVVIDFLLSYDIKLSSGAYKLGYKIAHYKLLERCFQNGIDMHTPSLTYTHIINSLKTNEKIIKLIELCYQYNYNLNEYADDFIMSWKFEVIKFIASKKTYTQEQTLLDRMAGCIDASNSKPIDNFYKVSKYFIEKTKKDCGVKPLQSFLFDCCLEYYELCNSEHYEYYRDDEDDIDEDDIDEDDYQKLMRKKYIYIIRELIINGADINDDGLKHFLITFCNGSTERGRIGLNKAISDLIVTNTQATQIIDDIASVLLPDIANVVFDNMYCYKFSKATEQILV